MDPIHAFNDEFYEMIRMGMIKRFLIIFITCIFMFLGCSTIRVSQDFRPGTDFSDLTTFAWTSDETDRYMNTEGSDPLMNERIVNAVEQTLQMKGYQEVPRSKADFYIRFQYNVHHEIETDDIQTGVGFGAGDLGLFGDLGIGMGSDVWINNQGVLILDIMAPKNGKVLWRGKGTYRVNDYVNPEEKTQTVNELVEKILAQFPSK